MTTLKSIALELLQKYEESETSVIWEYSGDIEKSEENLAAEVAKYRELIDKYAEKEPRTWNNHQVACLLADMFDDSCACNYNGIDEWLPELCDFKDTCCPKPVGVACWEQFLKHSRARYCECGYEVR